MNLLAEQRIAIIATDGFEELELTEPLKALVAEGADVELLSCRAGEIAGYRHRKPSCKILVDRSIEQVDPSAYDALFLPGGSINCETLRKEADVLEFVRAIENAKKPIAFICHAAWVLIAAGLVRGRILTSYPGIRDDVLQAGGSWLDREVVLDGNWISSRTPEDLPAFNCELIGLLSRYPAPTIRIVESA